MSGICSTNNVSFSSYSVKQIELLPENYKAIVYDKILSIKIPSTVENAEEQIRQLELYLFGTNKATVTVTGTQLHQIFSGTSLARCDEIAALINKYSDKFEINTPERMANFLGQIGAETGLTKLVEDSYTENNILTSDKTRTLRDHNEKKVLKYCSLFEGKNADGSGCPYPYCNEDIVIPEGSYYVDASGIYYTKADSLKKLKVKVKLIMTDQQPNDPDFFNTVYACQLGNGNIDSGDGFRFRGRGFIQITGYTNYKDKVQAKWDEVHGKGNKDFLCRDATCDANLDAIGNDVDFSMQISLAFWKAGKCNDLAKDTSDKTIEKITVAVNGAKIGLPNRETYTKKAYEILKK